MKLHLLLRLALPGLGLCASFIPASHAEVKLPALISDNMVLMQETPANVWGTAEPAEQVTVSLRGVKGTATAGPDGKWAVKLEGLQPGDGADMTINGKNKLTIKNVAVGEV